MLEARCVAGMVLRGEACKVVADRSWCSLIAGQLSNRAVDTVYKKLVQEAAVDAGNKTRAEARASVNLVLAGASSRVPTEEEILVQAPPSPLGAEKAAARDEARFSVQTCLQGAAALCDEQAATKRDLPNMVVRRTLINVAADLEASENERYNAELTVSPAQRGHATPSGTTTPCEDRVVYPTTIGETLGTAGGGGNWGAALNMSGDPRELLANCRRMSAPSPASFASQDGGAPSPSPSKAASFTPRTLHQSRSKEDGLSRP